MKHFLISIFAAYTAYYFYLMENKGVSEYAIMYFNQVLLALSILTMTKNAVFD